MPLGFESISHGTIAFGFFNIDSDMLLLENYFLFADKFCSHVVDITEMNGNSVYSKDWSIYHIKDPADVGDLMSAIHGIKYTGFIGELYRKYSFPEKAEEFKQKPEGSNTQNEVIKLIGKYAEPETIPFSIDKKTHNVKIGVFEFSKSVFQELIYYVWRGGLPRWKDEIRPAYVLTMKEKVENCQLDVFKGLDIK